MKKISEAKIKAGKQVRNVRNTLKKLEYGKQDVQEELSEAYKPIVKAQEKVKETVDKKQDELIDKIQENQQELIGSVDMLSDIMSKQGSTSNINEWLSNTPYGYTLGLDTIEEEEEEMDKPTTSKTNGEEKLFTNYDVKVLKTHKFDPTLKNPPTQAQVRLKINSLNGQLRHVKTASDKMAKTMERDTLSKYLVALKTMAEDKKEIEKEKKKTKEIEEAYKELEDMYKDLENLYDDSTL